MAQDYTIPELSDPVNRGSDRVLTLSQMKDRPPIDSTGMTDKRLFTGENKLHGIKDPLYDLWHIRFEQGTIPEDLRQSFTSFAILFKHVKAYYNKRNIEVSEV